MTTAEPVAIRELSQANFDRAVAACDKLFSKTHPSRMASPVPGVERLYVGGLHVLNQVKTLDELGVTHILSALKISTSESKLDWSKYEHKTIEVDDVEDENLLVSFEETGAWIEKVLQDGGVVYVHCLMGMSRSVTLVIAYILRANKQNVSLTAERVLAGIRKSRSVACPNDGFMAQLNLYKEMGCPKDVESHPKYQRWVYMQGVELATAAGMAPDYILFEDENIGTSPQANREDVIDPSAQPKSEVELRCKRCRRTLATTPYLADHLPKIQNSQLSASETYEPISSLPPAPTHNICTHHFLHPLSWMRTELEQGLLNGRLECPNVKCKAQLGKYAWQGMKCSCGIWVCPAFSLQKGRVDEVTKRAIDIRSGPGASAASGGGTSEVGEIGSGIASLGIRMPPGMRKENL